MTRTAKALPSLDPRCAVRLEFLLEEVREGYDGIVGSLQTITFGDRGHPYPTYPPAGDGARYIQGSAREAHAYAIEGDRSDVIRLEEDFLDLSTFCQMARVAAEQYGGRPPVACEKVMVMARLRSRLDRAMGLAAVSVVLDEDGETFSLFEIAMLAQMHEKSVRNATQPTAPDRLFTIRVGKSTRVDAREAAAWLSRRRGFKVTTVAPRS